MNGGEPTIKWDLKIKPVSECRCDERLKTEVEESTRLSVRHWVVYYESRKRELKTRPIYECRCDERLKTKNEESTLLSVRLRSVSRWINKKKIRINSLCNLPDVLTITTISVIKDTTPDGLRFVYYESIKRGLKRRLIYEYRCERLKTKNEESTLLRLLVDT
jgi:hypothetical protein